MLAHKVDSAHHHPLVVSLKLVVSYIVSAKRKGLGENLLLACLRCNRGYLHGRQAIEDISSKPVHTGNSHILVMGHARALGVNLNLEVLLKHHVTCKAKSVRYTLVVDLLHVVL